jgi:hypothetical protein
MSDTALFVGWGETHPGREAFARKHLAEFNEIMEEMKAKGEIESYETVLLDPHGGDLDGFTLVHAPPDKLVTLWMRDDLNRLAAKAKLDHAKFGVIWATTGEGVQKQFSLTMDAIAEYEREPALV